MTRTAATAALAPAAARYAAATGLTYVRTLGYLLNDEKVIISRCAAEIEYLRARRPGRHVSLNRAERRAVWAIVRPLG
jgi:hypothetical protein